MKIISVIALLIIQGSASAAQLQGVQMPDQVQVEGKTLVLNGMGIRKATIFHVKVYIAGLYMEKKSADPKAILGSSGIDHAPHGFRA